MAAHRSTQAMICPPNTVPRALACWGRTYSVIKVVDSRCGLDAVMVSGADSHDVFEGALWKTFGMGWWRGDGARRALHLPRLRRRRAKTAGARFPSLRGPQAPGR